VITPTWKVKTMKMKEASPIVIDLEKLNQVRSLRLSTGSHLKPRDGEIKEACFMECVSYVSGELWSDRPKCVCPVVGVFLRNWNDGLRDTSTRTHLLMPLIARVIGSKSTKEIEVQRSYLALDWLVREQIPAWLGLAGLNDRADALRSLPAIVDGVTAGAANPLLVSAGVTPGGAKSDAASAARDAAWDAAWTAASYTASDTVSDTVNGAEWYSAWHDASDTVSDAARDETVIQLQASALRLVERMVELL